MSIKNNISNLERGAHDILNAGIGLYQTILLEVEKVRKEITNELQTMIKRGAADNTEMVSGLRSNLNRGIEAVKGVTASLENLLSFKK